MAVCLESLHAGALEPSRDPRSEIRSTGPAPGARREHLNMLFVSPCLLHSIQELYDRMMFSNQGVGRRAPSQKRVHVAIRLAGCWSSIQTRRLWLNPQPTDANINTEHSITHCIDPRGFTLTSVNPEVKASPSHRPFWPTKPSPDSGLMMISVAQPTSLSPNSADVWSPMN